tara:strand:+ start:97 stop:705 length:609 start_codon:yes stop_codon:yes gene_type:complete
MGKTVILDNGHGGVINGVYQTKGKRSPDWDKGVLYEGEFNRAIVNRIVNLLSVSSAIGFKVPYYNISPELTDVSLGTRVNRANKIYAENPNTYLLSIHANAGGGTGGEIFVHPEASDESRIIADRFAGYVKGIGGLKWRPASANNLVKEANYKILRKTNCPAMLLEVAFMDNEYDYELLWNEDFRNDYATALAVIIAKIYSE